ncbi:MAG: hypothetical protein JKX84_02115, partial [Flavobacteriales bacterium]|nr:hypothetical protein [Flavobacteriales bacterium]
MPYLSQTLNAAAEGKTFSLRFKYFFFLLASFVFLLPVPWLVVVIAITLLWYGIIGWTYNTALGKWMNEKAQAAARSLGKIMLKDQRDSPYLIPLFGVGIITPSLFVFSFWFQMQQETFNWWAVL